MGHDVTNGHKNNTMNENENGRHEKGEKENFIIIFKPKPCSLQKP
jgi:hypothetical protein